jgi:outer membrane lipoprotein SlyB
MPLPNPARRAFRARLASLPVIRRAGGGAVLALLLLTGCATAGPGEGLPQAGSPWSDRTDRTFPPRGHGQWQGQGQGTVTQVERVRAERRGPGVGAAVGGAIGAAIGRQMGDSPEGRTTGAVVGAVIGAVAGHHIEQSRARDVLRVTVRLDRGGVVVIEDEPDADFRPGDRVRVEGDRARRVASAREPGSEHTRHRRDAALAGQVI